MHRHTAVLAVVLFATACFQDTGSQGVGADADTDTDDTGSAGTADTGSTDDIGTGGTGEDTDTGTGTDLPPVELPDPVLWYTFDETLDDAVGDNHALAIGTITFTPSPEGHAASFAGDGHLDIGTFAPTFVDNLDAVTLALQYRSTQRDHAASLLSLGGVGDTVANNDFRIQVRSDVLEVVTETGLGEDHVTGIGDAPVVDEWHNLVIVFDGDLAAVFLSGELQGSAVFTPAETSSNLLLVGNNAFGHVFEGFIDDLQVYDRALSDDQAVALSAL